jgi:hypothetical protein
MSRNHLPIAIGPDGALAWPEYVPNGRACNCTCAACGGPLLAAQGEKYADHFRHEAGAECVGGLETALHLMAKQLLAEERRIALPRCEVIETLGEAKFTEVLVDAYAVEIADVQFEVRGDEDARKPDVVATWNGKPLLIEIRVTHAVDKVKRAVLRKRGVHAIEIDLSKMVRNVSREAVRRRLCTVKGDAGDRWLHHPGEAAARDRLKRKIEQVKARLREEDKRLREEKERLRLQAEAEDLARPEEKPRPADMPRWLFCDDRTGCWEAVAREHRKRPVFAWHPDDGIPTCPYCGAEVSL